MTASPSVALDHMTQPAAWRREASRCAMNGSEETLQNRFALILELRTAGILIWGVLVSFWAERANPRSNTACDSSTQHSARNVTCSFAAQGRYSRAHIHTPWGTTRPLQFTLQTISSWGTLQTVHSSDTPWGTKLRTMPSSPPYQKRASQSSGRMATPYAKYPVYRSRPSKTSAAEGIVRGKGLSPLCVLI